VYKAELMIMHKVLKLSDCWYKMCTRTGKQIAGNKLCASYLICVYSVLYI